MTRLLQSAAAALLLIVAMGCADSDPVGVLSADPATEADRRLAASKINGQDDVWIGRPIWVTDLNHATICGERYLVSEKLHYFIHGGGDTPSNRQHTVIQATYIATATNLATGVVYRWPGHFKLTFAGLVIGDDALYGTQTVVTTDILTGPGGLKQKVHSLWKLTIDANGTLRLNRETERAECV